MTDIEPELQYGFVPAKVVADLHDIGNWKVCSPPQRRTTGCQRRRPCALRVASHVLRRPHPGLAVRWGRPSSNVLRCVFEWRQRAWRLSSVWVRQRWTQLRAEAIERLQSSVWRLRATEMPTVRAHLGELVRFLSKLVGDPNFKISLTALHVCGALAEKADRTLAPYVSALLPALLHKLNDAKPVVRQANLKVRRPSAQASCPPPPTVPALCCRRKYVPARKYVPGWLWCGVSTRRDASQAGAVHAVVCKAAACSHFTDPQPAAVLWSCRC
jgi:hypothetical protein